MTHGASSRKPVYIYGNRVRGVWSRLTAGGSEVYELQHRVNGRITRSKLAAKNPLAAAEEAQGLLDLRLNKYGAGALVSDSFRIGFAVAYYEGEGTCGHYGKGIVAKIRNTDIEPLRQMQEWYGGTLNGPYPPEEPHHKPDYVWALQARTEVVHFIRDIYPFLLTPHRRDQAKLAFDRAGLYLT